MALMNLEKQISITEELLEASSLMCAVHPFVGFGGLSSTFDQVTHQSRELPEAIRSVERAMLPVIQDLADATSQKDVDVVNQMFREGALRKSIKSLFKVSATVISAIKLEQSNDPTLKQAISAYDQMANTYNRAHWYDL